MSSFSMKGTSHTYSLCPGTTGLKGSEAHAYALLGCSTSKLALSGGCLPCWGLTPGGRAGPVNYGFPVYCEVLTCAKASPCVLSVSIIQPRRQPSSGLLNTFFLGCRTTWPRAGMGVVLPQSLRFFYAFLIAKHTRLENS